jgi:hypothetical protein
MLRPDAPRLTAALATAALALLPGRGAALPLLDEELSLERAPPAALRVALADPAPEAPLDFDLLGEAPKSQTPPEDPSLRRRRWMLSLHQGLGIGLLGLQLATTSVGQLNYSDRFGLDNTARYQATHQVLAYTNLGAFAVTGAIALFAPRAKGAKRAGFDRVTVHRIGMAVATVGMLAQGLLGIQTARREGYLDKQDWGRGHLAVSYTTLVAMGVAVGALVL